MSGATRREALGFLMLAPAAFATTTASWLLAGCESAPATGPLPMKWDRHLCARCGMLISDQRFGVQVRGGPQHQTWYFDDIGCALHWLRDRPGMEVWVRDARDDRWLDARSAHYESGKISPMGYNYAAYSDAAAARIDFDALRAALLERRK